jgi:hypothetical protein
VNRAEETNTYAIILTFGNLAVNLQCWRKLKEQSKYGSSTRKTFQGHVTCIIKIEEALKFVPEKRNDGHSV